MTGSKGIQIIQCPNNLVQIFQMKRLGMDIAYCILYILCMNTKDVQMQNLENSSKQSRPAGSRSNSSLVSKDSFFFSFSNDSFFQSQKCTKTPFFYFVVSFYTKDTTGEQSCTKIATGLCSIIVLCVTTFMCQS